MHKILKNSLLAMILSFISAQSASAASTYKTVECSGGKSDFVQGETYGFIMTKTESGKYRVKAWREMPNYDNPPPVNYGALDKKKKHKDKKNKKHDDNEDKDDDNDDSDDRYLLDCTFPDEGPLMNCTGQSRYGIGPVRDCALIYGTPIGGGAIYELMTHDVCSSLFSYGGYQDRYNHGCTFTK